MQMQITQRARSFFVLLATGAAAGFLGGFLGAGGGILLVYALSALNPDKSPAGVRNNFAATVACVLPVTALSAVLYAEAGHFSLSDAYPLFIPAAAGGLIGAWLLDRIDTAVLKKIFSVLVLWGGASMLLR